MGAYYDRLCAIRNSFLLSMSNARKEWNDDVQKSFYTNNVEPISCDSMKYASTADKYIEKLNDTKKLIDQLFWPPGFPQKIHEREY